MSVIVYQSRVNVILNLRRLTSWYLFKQIPYLVEQKIGGGGNNR